MGANNYTEAIIFEVEKSFTHEKFSIKRLLDGYDVALLKLAKPVTLDGKNVTTIDLANQSNKLPSTINVIGWGMRVEKDMRSLPTNIHETRLDVIDNSKCSKMLRIQVSDLTFCTYKDTTDSCQVCN